MTEAGVNLVTVGVFSWSRLQPAPGELTAGWLDRVLGLLARRGSASTWPQATASPPPWLVTAHPEILPVTADGQRLAPGARQHYCPSAPAFRAAAVDLAGRMAERYAEPSGRRHVARRQRVRLPRAACYCELSAAAFRGWLRARYGEIDALNEAWGGGVLEPGLHELGPGAAAAHGAHLRQPGPAARLRQVQLRLSCSPATAPSGKSSRHRRSTPPLRRTSWASSVRLTSSAGRPTWTSSRWTATPTRPMPESYLLSAMTCDLTRSVAR